MRAERILRDEREPGEREKKEVRERREKSRRNRVEEVEMALEQCICGRSLPCKPP